MEFQNSQNDACILTFDLPDLHIISVSTGKRSVNDHINLIPNYSRKRIQNASFWKKESHSGLPFMLAFNFFSTAEHVSQIKIICRQRQPLFRPLNGGGGRPREGFSQTHQNHQTQSQRMAQRILKSQVTDKLFCKFTDHRVFNLAITDNTQYLCLKLQTFSAFSQITDVKKAQSQVTEIPLAAPLHRL